MHFGKYLDTFAKASWRGYYIDYKALKNHIEKIVAAQKGSGSRNTTTGSSFSLGSGASTAREYAGELLFFSTGGERWGRTMGGVLARNSQNNATCTVWCTAFCSHPRFPSSFFCFFLWPPAPAAPPRAHSPAQP